MSVRLRPLTTDDMAESARLGGLAFGAGPEVPAGFEQRFADGRTTGAFDARGRLVGQATVWSYEQWFGGRRVPMGGVASVAVATSARGQGVAQAVLTALLPRMRERGQVISTLFPTAVGLYRGVGWELAGQEAWWRVPAALLATARAPAPAGEPVTVRPAEPADTPAMHAVYRRVAASTGGMLERAGTRFPAVDAGVAGYDEGLVAEAEGSVVGYTAYNRGSGYGERAVLVVPEVLGDTAPAVTALMRALGTWASVVPSVRIRLLSNEAGLLVGQPLPMPDEVAPAMTRVVDVAGAVAARGWPDGVRLEVDLEVVDPQAGWQAGRHRLVLRDGEAGIEPGGRGDVRFSTRALGPLFAGAAGTAVLRRAGLLSGDAGAARRLDVAFAGPRPQLLDYF